MVMLLLISLTANWLAIEGVHKFTIPQSEQGKIIEYNCNACIHVTDVTNCSKPHT